MAWGRGSRRPLIAGGKASNRGGMERYDFRTKRLFVEAALAAGASLEANRSQANYLLNVLRLKADDNVLVFNGRDGEWLAGIEPDGRKACRLRLIRQTRSQTPGGDLWYLFAPLKQARLDYMVQKSVEMGVSALVPVLTAHTQISRLNTERMRANAIEAAEQCGILSLPEVRDPARLETALSGWPAERRLVYCDEAPDSGDPITGLARLKGHRLAVLVGPEGGFSGEERAMLRAMPCVVAIALGPRILRADTAAVAALALVQALAGDWTPTGSGVRDS